MPKCARDLPLLFSACLFFAQLQLQFLSPQDRRGLEEFPGAPNWLVYPWEPGFAVTCGQIPSSIQKIIQHVGQDDANREVLFVNLADEHMTLAESPTLAQQALCGLDSVAKSIGWTRPHVSDNMFRMSLVVDCSGLSLSNWLPCLRCTIRVISAIQPFVSPFYDRLAGVISVLDPPSMASSAWLMVMPWLAQPTREVVRFVRSSDFAGYVPHAESAKWSESGSGEARGIWLLPLP
mmetsp:Transcript_9441/g.17496  ORF Transcript_9441/g.17496 Transcript_9441/m.17496 type:complete len:235 (+) Transcript_9441:38-742(+)